ncbi:MAG: DUF2460 domain-containing protein [Burkholderiales bacterium]|jgi:hypothetical protein
MSSLVFPTLPGIAWPVKRIPRWKTHKGYSASGRRFATTYYSYPIWGFKLKAEFLRSAVLAEAESLMSFFNQLAGGYDYFLFTDPDYNSVTAQQIGVGNGTQTDFALLRTIASFSEPVGEKNAIGSVTINGTPTAAYSLVDNRIVRFNTAPSAGQVLRWTGTYYMRCEFMDDELVFEEFMNGFHSVDSIEFQTVKG